MIHSFYVNAAKCMCLFHPHELSNHAAGLDVGAINASLVIQAQKSAKVRVRVGVTTTVRVRVGVRVRVRVTVRGVHESGLGLG